MAGREVQVRFQYDEQAKHAQSVLESARGYLKRETFVGHIRDEVLRAPASARPVDIASYVLREVDQALHALQVAHDDSALPRYAYGVDDSASKHRIAWSVTDTMDGTIAALFVENCPPGTDGFEIGTPVYADAINRVRDAARLACVRLNNGEAEPGAAGRA